MRIVFLRIENRGLICRVIYMCLTSAIVINRGIWLRLLISFRHLTEVIYLIVKVEQCFIHFLQKLFLNLPLFLSSCLTSLCTIWKQDNLRFVSLRAILPLQ